MPQAVVDQLGDANLDALLLTHDITFDRASTLREVIEAWFFTLEEDVLAGGGVAADDVGALATRVDDLMERRLGDVARTTPAFAAALRAYRKARLAGDEAAAGALLAAGRPAQRRSVGPPDRRPQGRS
jgi:hypothetical protein